MSLNKEFVFTFALASMLVSALKTLPILAESNVQEGDGAPHTGKADRVEGNVRQNIDRSEASQAEQYWTPERMQNAQPLPLNRSGLPKPVSQPQQPSDQEVSGSSSSSGKVSPSDQK